MRPRDVLASMSLITLCTACGGASTAPSSIPADAKGLLEGVWTGTLSTIASGTTYSGPVTVTFTTTPLTGAISYRAHLQVSNGYLAIDNTGDAITGFPGAPPTTFSLDQNYPSTHGTCRGDLHISGQVETASRIDADILGVETCATPATYTGHLALTRSR